MRSRRSAEAAPAEAPFEWYRETVKMTKSAIFWPALLLMALLGSSACGTGIVRHLLGSGNGTGRCENELDIHVLYRQRIIHIPIFKQVVLDVISKLLQKSPNRDLENGDEA